MGAESYKNSFSNGYRSRCCRSRYKTLKKYRKKYPLNRIYKTIDEALLDDFDAYIVSTPAETHFDVAKKIILSKKHVLIEKPMTLSISDAEMLVELAKKNKITIIVGHVLLFHPAIVKMKEIISDGKIGEMQYLYSNRLNMGKVRVKENVFWSLAPHDVAIFQHLTSSYPKKIFLKEALFFKKVYLTQL